MWPNNYYRSTLELLITNLQMTMNTQMVIIEMGHKTIIKLQIDLYI